MALFAHRISREIGSPERRAAAYGLDIDSASAAGAVVDHEVRMPAQQFVPEGIQSLDPANLGDALAVRGIRRAPEFERRDVGVVAVAVEAELVPDPSRGSAPK